MSYQVLARKWRPKSFEQLVGQKQTAKALINALETQRLHHAYLFTGTRGVGKTTIARILSKSLNCETGLSSNPCGECSSCIEIDQGNFVDLMEIDAASKTKVEDTRELLDNVQYRPTRGRYKVYLIDEVHMLSGHSFNALLKTLEEPPPHVVFLLATTDPQKLPVTVLSRCLQFHLRRMEQPQIIEHLSMILSAEQIDFEPECLVPIAKGADGSMRDALSLLDQAIAYCGDKLELVSVLEMLGSIDQSYCQNLLQAIQSNDAVKLMAIIQEMSQYSPDYLEVMSDWLSLLHQLAVSQATGNSENDSINELAQSISAADLQLYYQLSLQAKKDLPYAPHPRQGFEMALLRVMAFRPQTGPVVNHSPDPAKKKLISLSASEAPESTEKSSADNQQTVSADQSRLVEANANANSVSAEKLHLVADNSNQFDQTPSATVNKNISTNSTNQAMQLATQAEEPIVGYPSKLQSVKVKPLAEERPFKASSLIEDEQIVSQKTPIENNELVEMPVDESVRHYPQIADIKLQDISAGNWHYVVDQLNVEGNGLQVLLNSLADFEKDQLVIKYLDKVEHFLTENLLQSLVAQIKHHFQGNDASRSDSNNTDIKINLIKVDQLAETPKEKLVLKHQAAIEDAYQTLMADPCLLKLKTELSGTLDRKSIQLG